MQLMSHELALQRTALSQLSVPLQITVQLVPLQVTGALSQAPVPTQLISQSPEQVTAPSWQAPVPMQPTRHFHPAGQVMFVPFGQLLPRQFTSQVIETKLHEAQKSGHSAASAEAASISAASAKAASPGLVMRPSVSPPSIGDELTLTEASNLHAESKTKLHRKKAAWSRANGSVRETRILTSIDQRDKSRQGSA